MEFFRNGKGSCRYFSVIIRCLWPALIIAGLVLVSPAHLEIMKQTFRPFGGLSAAGVHLVVAGIGVWIIGDFSGTVGYYSSNKHYLTLLAGVKENGVSMGVRATSYTVLEQYMRMAGTGGVLGAMIKLFFLFIYYFDVGSGLKSFEHDRATLLLALTLGAGLLVYVISTVDLFRSMLVRDKSTKLQFILRFLIILLVLVSNVLVCVVVVTIAEQAKSNSGSIVDILPIHFIVIGIGLARFGACVLMGVQSSDDDNAIPVMARVINIGGSIISTACYSAFFILTIEIIPTAPVHSSVVHPYEGQLLDFVGMSLDPYSGLVNFSRPEVPGFDWLYTPSGHLIIVALVAVDWVVTLFSMVLLIRKSQHARVAEEHNKMEIHMGEDELEVEYTVEKEAEEFRAIAMKEAKIRKSELLWTLGLHAKPMAEWSRVETRVWLAHHGLLRFCKGIPAGQKKKSFFPSKSTRSGRSDASTISMPPTAPAQRRFSLSMFVPPTLPCSVFSIPAGLQLILANEQDIEKEYGVSSFLARKRFLQLRQWWRSPRPITSHMSEGWESITPQLGMKWLASIGLDSVVSTTLSQYSTDGALFLTLKKHPDLIEKVLSGSINALKEGANPMGRRRSIIQRARSYWKKLKTVMNAGGRSTTLSQKRLAFLKNSFEAGLKLLSYANGEFGLLEEWKRMKYSVAYGRHELNFELRKRGFLMLETTGLHGALLSFGNLSPYELAEAILPREHRTVENLEKLEEALENLTTIDLPDAPDEVVLEDVGYSAAASVSEGSGSDGSEMQPRLLNIFQAFAGGKLPRSTTL
uniref:Uncharacterized protein n=1 Tax=Palpitomonas bilix TaxID=652834 RepID=A0A7S3LSB5_9EUKA|mmetsp:Transcript_44278/g.115045  ORF Transcript_44278/g.115045 Transcript_44278/m.115045 type:complete len:805 (+) Transcript_44278:663-3077(+)